MQTIESARIKDETMVAEEDPALVADFADDEFAGAFTACKGCRAAHLSLAAQQPGRMTLTLLCRLL